MNNNEVTYSVAAAKVGLQVNCLVDLSSGLLVFTLSVAAFSLLCILTSNAIIIKITF